jgi:hypothetical protein
METIVPILLTVLGVTVFLSVCFLVCIQPIWGLIDVAESKEHSRGVKATVIVLTLFLLGPLMTIGYAIFGAHSKQLRRTTLGLLGLLLVSLGSLVGLALTVPAMQSTITNLARQAGGAGLLNADTVAALAPGTGVESERGMGESGGTAGHEWAELTATTPPVTQLEPFTALDVVPNGQSTRPTCITKFSINGPSENNRISLVPPSIYPITQLAVDFSGPTLYAITTHEIGTINPKTGEFSELEPDPAIGKPSWPSAIAFDSERGLLLIAARSSGYSYEPSTGKWKALPGLKGDDLVALQYDEENRVLYGLRSKAGSGYVTSLIRVTPQSATVEEIPLSSRIPIGSAQQPMTQLCQSGDRLVVVVSPSESNTNEPASSHPTLFSVEPASGVCRPVELQLAAGKRPTPDGG